MFYYKLSITQKSDPAYEEAQFIKKLNASSLDPNLKSLLAKQVQSALDQYKFSRASGSGHFSMTRFLEGEGYRIILKINQKSMLDKIFSLFGK